MLFLQSQKQTRTYFSFPFRLGKKEKHLSIKTYFFGFSKCVCGLSYKANNATISLCMKVSSRVQVRTGATPEHLLHESVCNPTLGAQLMPEHMQLLLKHKGVFRTIAVIKHKILILQYQDTTAIFRIKITSKEFSALTIDPTV